MANRAYLLVVNDRNVTSVRNPRREILAEGINEIPVFWASLFVSADRQVDVYQGESGLRKIMNWCVKSATAKERIRALREPIADLLDKRSQELWKQWIRLIDGVKAKLLKTNAAEVWALDPKGYRAYGSTLLRAFSKPSVSTMRSAVERNGLEYIEGRIVWGDIEETLCKLAGSDHIRRLPWLNSKLDWFYNTPPEEGEPRTIFDEIFDAMSPDDRLEDAVRKARAMLRPHGFTKGPTK